MMRPCLSCGEPSPASHCDEHQPKGWQHRVGSARERGYDNAWNRLSRRARRLSPLCELCGTTANLTTDHLPIAWQRKAEGKSIRLVDVRVLCSPCNVDAGSSRPETHGTGTLEGSKRPRRKAQSPLHTFGPYMSGGAG